MPSGHASATGSGDAAQCAARRHRAPRAAGAATARRQGPSRCTRSPTPRHACASSGPSPTTTWCAPQPGVALRFRDAGHILGSAIVGSLDRHRRARERKLVFSGDLGQPGRPVHGRPDADRPTPTCWSSNRPTATGCTRTLATTYDEFAGVLAATLPRGNVRHPRVRRRPHAGSAARAGRPRAAGPRAGRSRSSSIRRSPRARPRSPRKLRGDARSREPRPRARGSRSTATACACVFTETPQDSMAINSITRGAVIVAASGMCEGGRIRHHLRHNLPREECAIVFTGFQAARHAGAADRRRRDARAAVSRGRAGARVACTRSAGCPRTATRPRCSAGWRRSGSRRRAPSSSTASATTAVGFAELVRERLHWPSVEVPARGDRSERVELA